MTKNLVLGAVVGLALGTFAAVLIAAVSSILAFTQATRIEVPGIFAVWADDSTGSPGLAFLPNFVGIVVFIIAVTLVCMGLALYGRSRTAAQ